MSGVKAASYRWRAEEKGYVIDNMNEHDLLEVVEIETECELSKWGWEAYYNEITNGAIMLVARTLRPIHPGRDRVHGTLCGFSAARLLGNQLHINNLGVKTVCRRAGVGQLLLEMTLQQAARAKAEIAHLEVRPSNKAAIALYLRHGFSIIGRRPHYYASPPEDALLMSATIQTEA